MQVPRAAVRINIVSHYHAPYNHVPGMLLLPYLIPGSENVHVYICLGGASIYRSSTAAVAVLTNSGV